MLDSSKPYCGMGNIRNLNRFMESTVNNSITVPNHILPEKFHDHKSGERTLALLEKMCDKQDGLTEHKKEKMIKAENIKRLAAQVPADGQLTEGFDYSQNETNDLAQYRAECALVDAMIKGGVIEADELREDDAIEFGNSVFYKGK